MAGPPSFHSWESTWNRYGPLVVEVARALDPQTREGELAVAVVKSAAHGLLDPDSVDPLAALLTELLRDSSATNRSLAAQILMHSGIDDVRAYGATSVRSRSTSDLELRSEKSLRPRFFGRSVKRQRITDKPGGARGLLGSSNMERKADSATLTPRYARPSTNADPREPGLKTETTPTSIVPAFAVVQSQALALWHNREQQKQSDPIDQTVLVKGDPDFAPTSTLRSSQGRPQRRLPVVDQADEEEATGTQSELADRQREEAQIDQKGRKRRKRRTLAAGLLVAVFLAATAVSVLGPRLLSRIRGPKNLPLLTVKDLPKQWKVTIGSAYQPASILLSTAVFQRFDSLDKKQTVLVTTRRDDQRFADWSLGTPKFGPNNSPFTEMVTQAQATASDSFPVHTRANTPVMMQWKQPLVPFTINQSETVVYLEARGMPSSDVQAFGRALTARRNLLEQGWSTPKGFSEQISRPTRRAFFGTQSSLTIVSALDGKSTLVLQMYPADAVDDSKIDNADLYDRPEEVVLPSGRKVSFSRNYTHNYWWTESGYEFRATVLRSDLNDGTTEGIGSQQFFGASYSRLEPLPDRHLDGMLDLLDRVGLGNDKDWQALTAKYQRSLQDLPSIGTVTIDGHQLVTRTAKTTGKRSTNASRLPYALCTPSICARVYNSWNGLAKEADILIDGHWWHFRQIANYDKTIPKYFTSPDIDTFKTGRANFDRVYSWWGVDFGPKVTAARNESESQPLLRPLPRS
jgi:hypothetical protein